MVCQPDILDQIILRQWGRGCPLQCVEITLIRGVPLIPLSVPYLTPPGGLGLGGSVPFGLWLGPHSPVQLYG